MVLGERAYLYGNGTVVINKSDIKGNTSDKDFKPVTIYIDEKYIRDWYKQLEIITD